MVGNPKLGASRWTFMPLNIHVQKEKRIKAYSRDDHLINMVSSHTNPFYGGSEEYHKYIALLPTLQN
jgi:hypothetical protein